MDISKYKSREGKSGLDLLKYLCDTNRRYNGPAFYIAWDKDTGKEEIDDFVHACHVDLMPGGRNYVILGGLFSDKYTGPVEEVNRYWAWLFGEDEKLPPPYPDVVKNIHKVWKDKDGNYIGFFLDLTECNCEAVRHWLIMSRGPHEMYRTVRGWNMLVEGGVHPVFALWLAHQVFYIKRNGHDQDKTKWSFFLGRNASVHTYMPEVFNNEQKLKSLDLETVFKPGTRLYKTTLRKDILPSLTKKMTRKDLSAFDLFCNLLRSRKERPGQITIVTSFGRICLPKESFAPKSERSKDSGNGKDTRPTYQLLIEAALELQKELHNVA